MVLGAGTGGKKRIEMGRDEVRTEGWNGLFGTVEGGLSNVLRYIGQEIGYGRMFLRHLFRAKRAFFWGGVSSVLSEEWLRFEERKKGEGRVAKMGRRAFSSSNLCSRLCLRTF